MLYIRTDGNAEIGIGHVMRCLSIAQVYRNAGNNCIFIIADEKMKSIITAQGFSTICLHSIWDDLDQEVNKMEKIIHENNIEKLLVDSYFVTPEYLSRLHKLTNLTYLDDLNAFTYPCSTLINYNIYADRLDYSSLCQNTRLCLGSKYVPLRKEFCNIPLRKTSAQAKTLLVTTGGSDRFNVAGQLVKRAMKLPTLSRLHFNIVVGNFNPNLRELQALSNEFAGITLHQNINNISKLMLECDMAVSAAGSTLYELCACGVPTIVFSFADNQQAAVSAFSDQFMLGCGDWRDGSENCLNKLVSGIEKLAEDAVLRKSLSEKCRMLVDGHGASRISDMLKK